MEASNETVRLASTGSPDLEANFSCCNQLCRITALESKAKVLKEGTVCQGEVKVEEIANAETQLSRIVQKNLKTQKKYSPLEGEFRLYEDSSGVLRCKGRTVNAELRHETFPASMTKFTASDH